MKFFNKIILTVASLVLLVAFASCQIGLGESVDLQAPVINVTSHKDNDSVAEKFTLRGTASDNEIVTIITIDFEDADIHYQIEPGQKWFKKTSTMDWTAIDEDEGNYCRGTGASWEWSIDVDTADKSAKKDDSDTTFVFTALVKDKIGNSGKSSKVDCSLVVDTKSPVVSIYQPELFADTYVNVANKTGFDESDGDRSKKYQLKDGNVISRLLNGKVELSGRIDQSISFKGLRIDFDNGKLDPGTRKCTADVEKPYESIETIVNEVSLGDADEPTIYYTKTLTDSNLRTWKLTVNPSEWATETNGLNKGKHLIRVVTTCLSASNEWERKVIGYFIWYPEADIPWITVNSCDDDDKDDSSKYACYPGSKISGSCQDDDGVESLVSKIYKRDENGYTEVTGSAKPHLKTGENPKYAAFAVDVPSENGSYKVEITVTDINNNSSSVIKYFKTSDVKAPTIEITNPSDNSSAINSNGKITFTGEASDDGNITSFAVVWLNPINRLEPENKIKYLTGDKAVWEDVDFENNIYTDENGNKVYKLGSEAKRIPINKTFDLYNDLKIGTKIGEKFVSLETQDFIFRASDGISTSIKEIILTGDTETPNLEFTSITVDGKKESLTDGNIPTFARDAQGKTATIEGKWSDDFNSSLKNTDKIQSFTLQWGKSTVVDVAPNSNGTWTATVTAPEAGGTITASIVDYGNNKKTVQSAASIETSELGLARITCDNEDGSYKAGDVLIINLEFTKNTNVIGTPTLTLNNGGKATYVGGTGTTVHAFEYTVLNTDKDTAAIEKADNKLSVTGIVANGAMWTDAAVSGEQKDLTNDIVISKLPSKSNLGDTRSIAIDNTPPRVKSVTALSSSGYYKAGASLLFMVEFSEDVEITTGSDFAVKFAHGASAGNANRTGSKYVLFTYDVKAGDNASGLSFNGFNTTGVTVVDAAKNEISSWTPVNTSSLSGIIVDTESPLAPVISYDAVPGDVVLDEAGVSFTVSGETGASVEYSLDNGGSWIPYKSKVTVTNNGNYTVTARQTDKAGNVSDLATSKTFTIDKGELFKTITATTPNGSYSTKTSTKVIAGKIEFRKAVKIAQGASVTLNVKNGTSTVYKTCEITECASTAATSSSFTFDYTIAEGDKVDSTDNILNVTGWSFDKVTLDDKDVSISFPAEGNQFKDNRTIKILTGIPEVQSCDLSGEGSDAVLTVTYDRNISKVNGNIVFEYDTTISGNDFHVPAVLTASEYNELKSNAAISNNYEPGTNGAVRNGTTLTNDTSTKYILKTSVSDTDAAIVKVFKDAGKHRVSIPVISDQVEITSLARAADGKILKVTLGEAYALPVKGAQYKLTIQAGAVTDDVKNVNAEYTQTVTAAGVEAPQIRIVKPKYSIANIDSTKPDTDYTTTATVDMSSVQTADMYLSSRTPGATIYYGRTSETDAATVAYNATGARKEVIVHSNPCNVTTTKTADVAIPSANTQYNNRKITLGSDNAVNSFGAQGLKFAIAAKAVKDGVESATNYEYATRTVVKFYLHGYRDRHGQEATDYNSSLKMSDLRVWLCGGDSTAGPNGSSDFPLAWSDSSKFKLMAGAHTGETEYLDWRSMFGQWWYVSWDITSTTYIGFVIGNVRGDSNTNGPSFWYLGDYLWALIKEEYPLYPGETLFMETTDGVSVNGENTKTPYGANFAFNKTKGVTR